MFILKFNVALKILLVVSIVLQSLTAVVSATPENHQIDIEHLQIQHDHADDRNVSNDNVGDEQHNEKDCHHCGHCSGSHLSWILVSNSNTTGKLNIINKKYLTLEDGPPILKQNLTHSTLLNTSNHTSHTRLSPILPNFPGLGIFY